MKKIAVIMALVLCAAFAFAACTKSTEQLVKGYVDQMQGQVADIAKTVEGVMDVRCIAEGTNMVFEYKYLNDIVGDASALRSSLDSMGGTYKELYDQLFDATKDDKVGLIIRYLDKEGKKILDYVVDKDYKPGENAGKVDTDFSTLDEYVNSDMFKNILAAYNTDEITVSARAENGNVLVVEYTLVGDMSEEELATVKENWDANMASTGESSTESMKAGVALSVTVEDLQVVYNLLDNQGNVISTYHAE